MMNLEELRRLVFSQSKTVMSGGVEFRLGKLAAQEVADLQPLMVAEADSEQSNAAFAFYSALLSKSLVGESGRLFDSDEARKELPRILPWNTLVELGQAALEFNGLGQDAKKN